VESWISAATFTILTEGVHCYPKPLQASDGIVPWNRSSPFTL
jgi:hypothetical protein